jgi:hypothetical protein
MLDNEPLSFRPTYCGKPWTGCRLRTGAVCCRRRPCELKQAVTAILPCYALRVMLRLARWRHTRACGRSDVGTESLKTF